MTVSAAVQNILDQHSITVSVIADVHTQQLEKAKSMVFQDNMGQVQVIYPAPSIIDIDALCQLTDRKLTPLTLSEIQALCQKSQLEHLPSLPGVLGLETIVDQTLVSSSELTLHSGSENHFIKVNNSQFNQLIEDVTVVDFSVSDANLKNNALGSSVDVEQITHAITNFTQLRIKQRLEDTIEIPPLPETAQRIIKLRVDPNADIKDLTNIVESDPPLAALVVSWAASPYYAAPGKIKSVSDAIVRVLGFDLVLNLSLGLALGNTLKLPKEAAKGFTPYWLQATYASTAVEALVATIPPKQRPTMGLAYLTGLLHNFGYLILAEVFPPHFANCCRHQEANPYANHSSIERHILGINREQLGSWLMELWDMPEEVCTALRFQQEADFDGDNSEYANILFIAMHLLKTHGIGDGSSDPIPEAMYERLHLDREKANEAIRKVIESATQLNAMASAMAA